MKKVRFLTGILLTMSVLFTFGFSASAENPASVTLGEQAGVLEKSVIGNGHQMFYDAGIVIKTDDVAIWEQAFVMQSFVCVAALPVNINDKVFHAEHSKRKDRKVFAS